MKIALTGSEAGEFLSKIARNEIGFVPTMGALHAGHLSLVDRARRECGIVVVSIFVNPTQFNDKNDLKNYPRMPEADLAMLEKAGVDLVFMPSIKEMYPTNEIRHFNLGGVATVMEGVSRPGHFDGVADIVSRLFDIVKPGKSYFGEKDFQQIAVIKAMVRDGGYDVEIVPCEIMREADGLAMSSRNLLLTPAHRAAAPLIYKALRAGVAMKGTKSVKEVIEAVTATINADPLLEVVYFDIVNADTMADIQDWNENCPKQGCIVVKAGNIRLIDNIKFA